MGWKSRLQHWLPETFELGRTTGDQNLRAMEGLRGVAVILVFFVHFGAFAQPWLHGGEAISTAIADMALLGNTGVDLFFVLSGYLIYASLMGRAQPFVAFMKRRVRRLYPAFTVVFVLYVIVSPFVPELDRMPRELGAAALYLVENYLLLPGMFDIPPLITVAWSLSYEMFFYLLVPAFILALDLRNRTRRWRVAALLATTAALLVFFAFQPAHIRLLMFLSGMLLAEAMPMPTLPVPSDAFALTAALMAYFAGLLPFRPWARILMLFLGFGVLCYTAMRRPSGWLARALSVTPLRWLGNMSYSYYLLHGPALRVGFVLLGFVVGYGHGGPWFIVAMLPFLFACSLVPPALLYIFVERPFSLSAAKPARRTTPVPDATVPEGTVPRPT
jgi:peptidoglycan/LPS O-acetylase OafA/YrhL